MDEDEIIAHKRRLKHLKTRRALQGVNTPPEILIEIEDIEIILNEAHIIRDQNNIAPVYASYLDIVNSIDLKRKERNDLRVKLQHLYEIRANPILNNALLYPSLKMDIADLEKRIKELDTLIDKLMSRI
jgi:hypothetical protein